MDTPVADTCTFAFFVASPQGDLSVASEDLKALLEGCASGTTYGEYFAAIQRLLSRRDCRAIQALAQHMGHGSLPVHVRVRAEKHGSLYHPASLELSWPDGRRGKYAMLVALSGRGREALKQEDLALKRLHQCFHLPFLPERIIFHEQGELAVLIEPWFSGYHEFHALAGGGFCLWDYDQGLRPLSPEQVRQVFFQAARIMTLYIDPESGACIHPWSHAAGDFIVNMSEDGVDVRLTTARGYAPRIEADNPLSALFAFVLDLALRMRLDRVDGVGQWVWLGQDILECVVRGFFAALSERGQPDAALQDVARLLPSFSGQELLDGYAGILDTFSPGELTVILPNLGRHCRELAGALQWSARQEQSESICAG